MADGHLIPLLNALPLPTLAIDADERIIAANEPALALVGQGAQGRHFITLLRQPTLVKAVEDSLRDHQPRSALYLDADGSREVRYEVHMAQASTNGPLILSFQDQTQLTEAGQMRRDFVANVSHELRTPLTSLMGFIETLRGPAREDAAARDRFLGIMADEAGRMNRLVGDLLSLSRVEADERVRPTAQVDLADILGRTICNLRPLTVEADVAVEIELGPDKMPVLGDADQLVQVFTNLIENAIKYGGTGKTVSLQANSVAHDGALRAPAFQILIADQGPGIDPQHLPRLTERFYRADSHRSRALGGTGLGLAIVKHILNRHRGRLKVTSELGQGAQFSVILPLDPTDAG